MHNHSKFLEALALAWMAVVKESGSNFHPSAL
jgi:hypothetical protein